MQVVVNSILTNYERSGKGATILLLHGWGDSAKGVRPLTTALAVHHDVIAVDLPGFGGTQSPSEPWGLSDYADFVHAFVQKLGIMPYAIVGHSNGGAVAIRALARSVKTDKLVLLASAGVRGEYKGRMKILRLAAKTGKLVAAPLPRKIKMRLRRKMYSTIGSDLLVAEHLQETFKRVVQDDVRKDAARVRTPTLLVYGDKDISAPVSIGQKLHDAIVGSRLVVIPGAEHMLTTQNTAEVANLIEEFLR